MASITKRGNSWQYTVSRYINGEYKPIRKGGFRTEREARIEATEIENQLYRGEYVNKLSISFEEYFLEWVSIYKKNVVTNTRNRYLNTHQTIKDYFQQKPMQEIRKREYQLFINDYSKNHAKSTVKKLNSHIRSCVKTAIDEGVITSDFTRHVSLGGKEKDPRKKQYLNYKDALKLYKYISFKINIMFEKANFSKAKFDMRYFLLLLGLTTGMRFGEMVALQFNDFDFKKKLLNIDKTYGYTKNMAKGFSPTKNRETRIIKVEKQTMDAFKKVKPYIVENEDNLIFYNKDSIYNVVTNTSINTLLKSILKEVGASNKTLHIHGLRHTHASVSLYKGISIVYLSRRLGHNNVDTTYSYYSHLIKELEKKDEKKSLKLFD